MCGCVGVGAHVRMHTCVHARKCACTHARMCMHSSSTRRRQQAPSSQPPYEVRPKASSNTRTRSHCTRQATDLLVSAMARDEAEREDVEAGAGKRRRAERVVWRLVRDRATREARTMVAKERKAQLYLHGLHGLERAG